MLALLVLAFVFVGRTARPPIVAGANPLPHLAGLVPIFVAIILRWLVLPRRLAEGRPGLTFLLGVALAFTGGLLGLALGGPFRDILFVIGVLAVVQFAPFFARKPGPSRLPRSVDVEPPPGA